MLGNALFAADCRKSIKIITEKLQKTVLIEKNRTLTQGTLLTTEKAYPLLTLA